MIQNVVFDTYDVSVLCLRHIAFSFLHYRRDLMQKLLSSFVMLVSRKNVFHSVHKISFFDFSSVLLFSFLLEPGCSSTLVHTLFLQDLESQSRMDAASVLSE